MSARPTVADDLSLARFWAPRYWPTWLVWLAMRVTALLPFRWGLAVGRGFGRVLERVKRREHRTAARNLEICFPELAEAERAALLERHFAAVGMSFAEMAMGWFWPIERLLEHVEITGAEHVTRALAAGKGALMVGGHFTTLEVGVAVIESFVPNCATMYRPQRNAMMDVMIRRGRSRFARTQIPRDNVRALLRALRDNWAVMYMPDQTYLGKQSQLLPFFGEPALANTATSRLAAVSGAAVLPYFFRRLPDNSGYRVEIGEPLPGFPSGDPGADTLRLVALLEAAIRRAPEQYLWLYKKFKGRPPPLPDPYRAPP
ncbi:MAG TPA: lipid A biosynthesis lauroyl acyltransferase [Gammaproteobacteria bacterium]|nr:lipid A biosynthesis lauroyl acyltransferase [Gammaproteobacteria bacterium]